MSEKQEPAAIPVTEENPFVPQRAVDDESQVVQTGEEAAEEEPSEGEAEEEDVEEEEEQEA